MLNHSASLAMSTSVLQALPGKLDIKRHSPVFSIYQLNNGMIPVSRLLYYSLCDILLTIDDRQMEMTDGKVKNNNGMPPELAGA